MEEIPKSFPFDGAPFSPIFILELQEFDCLRFFFQDVSEVPLQGYKEASAPPTYPKQQEYH